MTFDNHATVTILRVQEDGSIGLYAGEKKVGNLLHRGRAMTLTSAAAKLGGKWVKIQGDTMARLNAIRLWRPESCGGVSVLIDGAAIRIPSRYWPAVRKVLEA